MNNQPMLFDEHAKAYQDELNLQLHTFRTDHKTFLKKKAAILKTLYREDLQRSSKISILDFGCGVGSFLSVLDDFLRIYEYTGYDPSVESIAEASRCFKDQPYRFLNDLNSIQGKYDLVIVSCVLHHVLTKKERNELITFLVSRLSPNGRVVVFEHNPYNPLTKRVVKDCVFDKDAILITCVELAGMVEEAKGTVLEKGYYGFFPFYTKITEKIERVLKSFPCGTQYYLSFSK